MLAYNRNKIYCTLNDAWQQEAQSSTKINSSYGTTQNKEKHFGLQFYKKEHRFK